MWKETREEGKREKGRRGETVKEELMKSDMGKIVPHPLVSPAPMVIETGSQSVVEVHAVRNFAESLQDFPQL